MRIGYALRNALSKSARVCSANSRMFVSRSVRSVSSVSASSPGPGPETAMQVWPASSPYRFPVGPAALSRNLTQLNGRPRRLVTPPSWCAPRSPHPSPKCVLGTPGDNENPLLNCIPLAALTALPLPPGGRPSTGTALKNCLVRTLLHIVPLCPTKPHKRLAHASHLASTNVSPELTPRAELTPPPRANNTPEYAVSHPHQQQQLAIRPTRILRPCQGGGCPLGARVG